MCRNIRTLYNFEPPATQDEVHAAALQYVRKISGFTKPSQANAETFERAIRLWHRFDPARGSERTWLCQIARTAALDHLRAEDRRRRREERYSSLAERTQELEAQTLSPWLRQALASLSAADREVIALRVILDLDPSPA